MRRRTPALPRASPPSHCPAAPRGFGTVSGCSLPSGRGGLPTLSDDLLSAECPSASQRRLGTAALPAPCSGTGALRSGDRAPHAVALPAREGTRRGAGGGRSCQHGLTLPHAAPPSSPNDLRHSFLISTLTPKEIK